MAVNRLFEHENEADFYLLWILHTGTDFLEIWQASHMSWKTWKITNLRLVGNGEIWVTGYI
jgi:hypothetical protein